MKDLKPFDCVSKFPRPYSQGMSADLNSPAVQRLGAGPQQDRRSHQALRPNQPDFDEFLATYLGSDGHKSTFEEVDVVHRQLVVMKNLTRNSFTFSEIART